MTVRFSVTRIRRIYPSFSRALPDPFYGRVAGERAPVFGAWFRGYALGPGSGRGGVPGGEMGQVPPGVRRCTRRRPRGGLS